MQCP